MTPREAAGRALLAAVFVHGGWCTLRDPGPRIDTAAPLLGRARVLLPRLPADRHLVRINAAVHLGGGVLLAAGARQQAAAAVLALSLIPTTLAGHPFWAADPARRGQHLIDSVKNAAVLGGLLLLTSSRP